jgi:hypothetical protein
MGETLGVRSIKIQQCVDSIYMYIHLQGLYCTIHPDNKC